MLGGMLFEVLFVLLLEEVGIDCDERNRRDPN
jgi:hypothetical protein